MSGFVFALQLTPALLFGAAIGAERQWRQARPDSARCAGLERHGDVLCSARDSWERPTTASYAA
jgi:hypothetical protein